MSKIKSTIDSDVKKYVAEQEAVKAAKHKSDSADKEALREKAKVALAEMFADVKTLQAKADKLSTTPTELKTILKEQAYWDPARLLFIASKWK